MGLLKYAERQDFATAARYLQLPPGQDANLAELAKKFLTLHSRFKGNVDLLSDDPNGTVESGLPPGQARAGVFSVGGTTVDIILVRVDDPEFGKIWLVSQETVARVPDLYAQMQSEGPTLADRIVPAALSTHHVLGMSLAQWFGWLFSIPISWLLAWLLAFLLSLPRRIWYNLRKLPFRSVWQTPLGTPLKCIIAVIIHGVFVYLLEPPLLYRSYYSRFLAALLAGCIAWLVSRIIDQGFDHAVRRTRQRGGGESILVMMQRLTHIVMLIIAFVAAMALFGINVKTTLAGLGIGGLAVALGAQKTLENIIGGVSLLMDKAVHVGDFCEIGGKLGTVEDIGLRSLKLRTLDQNLLVVPNGALAQMQFQNMKARPKLLIDTTFSLRIETRVEQLRFALDRVQSMLDSHPSIEPGSSRIRLNDFAGAAFELELFAYGKTGDWMQFTAIRQDVILKVAEIVESAGTQFAGPTQLTYLAGDAALGPGKRDDPSAV
ncbi:MAG TPA: mechanosensitive ion channel family protein [Candidatus Acidoferrum sp.]|nr:mechanosensitive ion channel family protein [Candidatus Acidoferrum sp.]